MVESQQSGGPLKLEKKKSETTTSKLCGCGKTPSYGDPVVRKKIWCKSCKPETAIHLSSKKCPCGKRPSFAYPGDKRAVWCATCPDKPDSGIINVYSKLCGCGKRATWAPAGANFVKWCTACKEPSAINLYARKCPCGKHASFKLPDGLLTWCATCPTRPPEAISAQHGKVKKPSKLSKTGARRHCPCGKRSSFGLPGQKAQWCASCPDKSPHAINVRSTTCACGKRPSFGLEDGRRIWCASCPDKPADAINLSVIRKEDRCSCGKKAIFGLESTGIAKWCVLCTDRPIEAIHLKKRRKIEGV